MTIAEPVRTPLTATAVPDPAEPYVQQLAPPWYPAFQRQRTPTAPGTWTAVNINWQGAIVAQLGAEPAQPNAPQTSGNLLVAYRRPVQVAGAVQEWRARFEPVAVTTRHPGESAAEVYAFLQVRSTDASNSNHYFDMLPLVPGRPLVLRAGSPTAGGRAVPGGNYLLRVGLFLVIAYRGFERPYGEGIANVRHLEHWGPDTGATLRAAAASSVESHAADVERHLDALVDEREPRGAENPAAMLELEG